MFNTKAHTRLTLCSVVVLMAACSGGGDGSSATGSNTSEVPEIGAANGAAVDNTVQTVNTEELVVPAQFDWSSDNEFSLDLTLFDAQGQIAVGTGVTVYAMPDSAMNEGNREPTDAELLLAAKLFSGVSDANGEVRATIQAPGHIISAKNVFVKTRLLGVPSNSVVPLTTLDDGSWSAAWTYGPAGLRTEAADEVDPDMLQNDGNFSVQNRNATSGNYYLQPFHNYYHWFYGHMPAAWQRQCDIQNAVAGALCTSNVEKEEIEKLRNIVVEGSQPSEKYLDAGSSESNLVFSKKASVIVTFLDEGAGYRNTFGFFTYNSNNEPTDHLTVDSARILFPNTSYRSSGGYLRSGDSVSLGEFDPANGHDAMGFYLAADGWNHNRGQGTAGQHFYTLDSLNPETDVNDRKHMLLIANEIDEATNTRRLWVAVEDIRLDSGQSDRDYNDLIMQIDVFPADALVFGDQIPDTTQDDDTVDDFDNDGVLAADDVDDEDPLRAFERYYPGEKIWGTLLAEDNWPALGDFDMNDMVVRYRIREVYDSSKQMKDLNIQYRLEARGAAFHNGFAVSLGEQVFADNIESAELNGSPVQPLVDTSALAYEIFGDTWAHTFEGDSTCWTFNTMSDCPAYDSTEFELNLTFANSVERDQILSAPYNPFLFAYKTPVDVPGYTRNNALNSELYLENGEIKDIEIHLPYERPTQGQDLTMFGSGDDSSDGVERFYVSTENLPWVIDVPDAIEYPEEFVDISEAFPTFAGWVQSGGQENMDWYRHVSDDDAMIYQGGTVEGEPSLGAAQGIVVSDNFQDQRFIPFNLQVRNTTGSAVNFEALVENVAYSSIPNLNLHNASMVTSDNGDGTYNHLFSGTLGAFQNIVMSGGVADPFGDGSGLTLFAE